MRELGSVALTLIAMAYGLMALPSAAQPAAQVVSGLPSLFLRESWRQRDRPSDAAADFVPEAGVTPAALTNADLELRLYDPNAKSVPIYLKQPPTNRIDRARLDRAKLRAAGRLQPEPAAAESRRRLANRSAQPLDRGVSDARRGHAAPSKELCRPARPGADPLGDAHLWIPRRASADQAG